MNPCLRCVWLRLCVGNYCGWRTTRLTLAKRKAWRRQWADRGMSFRIHTDLRIERSVNNEQNDKTKDSLGGAR